MKPRHLMFILLSVFLMSAVAGAADTPADEARPAIRFDSERYVSPPVLEGDAVIHDFTVKNTGTAHLTISRVRAG